MLTITVTATDAMMWALAALIIGIVATLLWVAYAWGRMVWNNSKEPVAEPPPDVIKIGTVPATPPVGPEGPAEMYRPDTITRKFR